MPNGPFEALNRNQETVSMKRTALALALVLLASSAVLAVPQMPEEKITGTVIDTACYAADKHGAEEEGCTEMCLNMGVPASVLTEDGEVIMLMPMADSNPEPYNRVKEFASQEVEITGMSAERGGLKVFYVGDVKARD
jgi:hypothetical protein